MKIHFVCTGNIYRSRLAESYLNFLIDKNSISSLTVSSSGVMADTDDYGPIAPNTLKLLKEDKLEKYAAPHWTQTTLTILSNQDLIVFMQPFHLQYCQKHFNYQGQNYQVWDIPDMISGSLSPENLSLCRHTFSLIKSKVDNLLVELGF